jgi:hypothetical protein
MTEWLMSLPEMIREENIFTTGLVNASLSRMIIVRLGLNTEKWSSWISAGNAVP